MQEFGESKLGKLMPFLKGWRVRKVFISGVARDVVCMWPLGAIFASYLIQR